jgi:hypothetical protein
MRLLTLTHVPLFSRSRHVGGRGAARDGEALSGAGQSRLSWFLHRIDTKSLPGGAMENETAELDELQAAYKAAVDEWIVAIKREEALASVNHTVAELDQWKQAHFDEDDARNKVLAAKRRYEDALRRKFFDF